MEWNIVLQWEFISTYISASRLFLRCTFLADGRLEPTSRAVGYSKSEDLAVVQQNCMAFWKVDDTATVECSEGILIRNHDHAHHGLMYNPNVRKKSNR